MTEKGSRKIDILALISPDAAMLYFLFYIKTNIFL